MGRQQINVRLSDDYIAAIDEKRIQLQQTLGTIPSRSDVVRMALDAFINAKPESGKKVGSQGQRG